MITRDASELRRQIYTNTEKTNLTASLKVVCLAEAIVL